MDVGAAPGHKDAVTDALSLASDTRANKKLRRAHRESPKVQDLPFAEDAALVVVRR